MMENSVNNALFCDEDEVQQDPEDLTTGVSFEVPSTHALRGDYSRMRADYTVDQEYEVYSEEEQVRWRFLYQRQMALLPDYASVEFLDGLKKLGSAHEIPRLANVNDILSAATGWTLVAVPGLIPNDVFFHHLAERRFPVSWWMRGADEMDYLVEPDIFHDFFGHVPLLSNQIFADYMQAIGEQGIVALDHGAEDLLARLYWYIIEFGLIHTDEGIKAFGAGMLSSKAETIYSVESEKPIRLQFNLERVMKTSYMVDDFQKTYFVIDNYQDLFDAIAGDLTPLFKKLKNVETIDPETTITGDQLVEIG